MVKRTGLFALILDCFKYVNDCANLQLLHFCTYTQCCEISPLIRG